MSGLKPKPTVQPSVFEYSDYREYLRDIYTARQRVRSSMSFRQFAKAGGLASPMHLKLVMDGKRNLTHKTIPKFRKGLRLNDTEGEFFENLVLFNQTATTEEKSRYFSRLSELRGRGTSRKLGKREQISLFLDPLFPVLYELCKVKDFREDAAWIEKVLRLSHGRVAIKQALRKLEGSELVTRDAQNHLQPADTIVKTDDEVENVLVRKFHLEMMSQARDRIDDPLADRDFRFLTVATTPEKFAKFKVMAREFFAKSNQVLSTENRTSTRVLQINMQSFWVT